MTRTELARQIVYYRTLRFDRRRILYELRRRLGARWNRRVLAFVDAVLAHGGMPPTPGRDLRRAALLDELATRFEASGKGPRRVRLQRFDDLAEAKRCSTRLESSLRRAGFAPSGVRGDVGQWAQGFAWRKTRGFDLVATVTVFERRRPYRVELELLLA